MTARERTIVRLVKKATSGEAAMTAVKVEMEGVCGRAGKMDTVQANDFLLEYLSQYGLAEKGSFVAKGGSVIARNWKPKRPLVFSYVYGDCETEWTMTLSLAQPENILLLPKLVDAFNALAKACGRKDVGIAGAGMHMSFLDTKDMSYPVYTIPKDRNRQYKNFKKSVDPLIPAMFMLSTHRVDKNGCRTRGMCWRAPYVSQNKTAIGYNGRSLEFRIFDPCYHNREAILDNVAVMCQVVNKFWRNEYVPSGLEDRILRDGEGIGFGTEDRRDDENQIRLVRLYPTKDRLMLLNKGLPIIKPPYLTVKQIKEVRKFNVKRKDLPSDKSHDQVVERYSYYREKTYKEWPQYASKLVGNQ